MELKDIMKYHAYKKNVNLQLLFLIFLINYNYNYLNR